MNRDLWRLLLICCAWSLGAVLTWAFEAPNLRMVVPALFAAGAFILTRDEGRGAGRGGGGGSGNVKYWRGRRVDDREPRRRN